MTSAQLRGNTLPHSLLANAGFYKPPLRTRCAPSALVVEKRKKYCLSGAVGGDFLTSKSTQKGGKKESGKSGLFVKRKKNLDREHYDVK